ncbi:ArsR/SmtB family transcription factor [Wenxinia marina]|uniref:Putative transcriptional regulator n=1 Tax=Wenxinia marina DSM 24838 TaxID=1123501 RepID=A0A0D0Q7L0_9RHOB|nr:metalloregulator ArsR/SmtB family transcription factor [Wenxinia marina]KIQ70444.1 putative transcriptional regulator [Wenxinia marina DSM 24838]GGL53109.1 transcriptional regulator [Wenxinia marina]
MQRNFEVVDPLERIDVLRALASEIRLRILRHLESDGPRNVNELAAELGLPQSTVSSNVQTLEEAGLVETRAQKARKGNQKICRSTFTDLLLSFRAAAPRLAEDAVEVSMPIGLYSRAEVSAPCGLCAPSGVIGDLDVPDTFLEPDRMRAGLLWFTRGFVEYQFPNNLKTRGSLVRELALTAELSSEVPGTSENWPSDITLWINGIEVGTWTSPGDFGDTRGTYTPAWWKLRGSQYGLLTTWRVTPEGTFIGDDRISDVRAEDLDLEVHRSVRVRLGIREDADHPGGLNLFGRGFGNHDCDIGLKLVGEASAPLTADADSTLSYPHNG